MSAGESMFCLLHEQSKIRNEMNHMVCSCFGLFDTVLCSMISIVPINGMNGYVPEWSKGLHC